MPALSCLCCSACSLDAVAVGPRGWWDGCGAQVARCVGTGIACRCRGKIRAPCILNRPIAPGNGCMGRGCCHLDLEKHAFRADAARKRAFFAHSAKGGCIRCDSCQPRARGRRNARGGRGRRRAVGAMWTAKRNTCKTAAARDGRDGGGDERGICSVAT